MSHPISSDETTYTAFCGSRRIAQGGLPSVTEEIRAVLEKIPQANILIFDDFSGRQIDADLRDPLAKPTDLMAPSPSRGPGRPKLGVIAREVTLLPRHWDWLNNQPGGASVALRKLVEEARHVKAGSDRIRQAQEATYKFLHAIAGNEPGFEDAMRALFGSDQETFERLIASWPGDIPAHARRLAANAF
jgi:uncharacterized protein